MYARSKLAIQIQVTVIDPLPHGSVPAGTPDDLSHGADGSGRAWEVKADPRCAAERRVNGDRMCQVHRVAGREAGLVP